MSSEADRFKSGLNDDIDAIIKRLDKVAKGKVRHVDAYTITLDGITKTLRGVKDSIGLAIINSKD